MVLLHPIRQSGPFVNGWAVGLRASGTEQLLPVVASRAAQGPQALTSSGAERVTSNAGRPEPEAAKTLLAGPPRVPIRRVKFAPRGQLLSILSTVVSGLVFSPFFPPTTTAGSPCSSAHE
jgi:hypothetical protein